VTPVELVGSFDQTDDHRSRRAGPEKNDIGDGTPKWFVTLAGFSVGNEQANGGRVSPE
jgi:hypothetical protein